MVYAVFLGLSSLWMSFLLFMAAVKNVAAQNMWYKLAYFLIGQTCHQDPSKSFYFMGGQIPVCARCFGIYAGLIAGLLIFPLFGSFKRTKLPDVRLSALFILPVLIDGFFNFFTTNEMRMTTGVIFGIGVIFYLLPVLNDICYRARVQSSAKVQE
jgi:uncharacterized membrane protein